MEFYGILAHPIHFFCIKCVQVKYRPGVVSSHTSSQSLLFSLSTEINYGATLQKSSLNWVCIIIFIMALFLASLCLSSGYSYHIKHVYIIVFIIRCCCCLLCWFAVSCMARKASGSASAPCRFSMSGAYWEMACNARPQPTGSSVITHMHSVIIDCIRQKYH